MKLLTPLEITLHEEDSSPKGHHWSQSQLVRKWWVYQQWKLLKNPGTMATSSVGLPSGPHWSCPLPSTINGTF